MHHDDQSTSPPKPAPASGVAKLFKPDPTLRLAWAGFRRWKAPVWITLSAAALVVLTWLPLAVAFEMRTNKEKREPRIHFIQDMDNQPKLRPQDESALFADHRAQRPKVPGTVARGRLYNDDAYEFGYNDARGADGKITRTFINAYPPRVQATLNDPAAAERFLNLGQQKFNLTCALCHGIDGQGNGPIAQRAVMVGATQTGWVTPSSVIDEVRRGRSDGHLYNTVNNGIRKMGGYGTQLNAEERWAVVAYVRTLQLAQGAPKAVLSADQQRGFSNLSSN